ncbi:MAG: InlB B-repeat-containing protein [Clostridia bacterium]|nr:InlB B-repeat-containing protein [Clostridia bacterium]
MPECSFNKQGYEFKGWNAQRKCDGKWYVQNKGWNSDADIIANNYTKNVYSDKWEGYLNNSWANNIVEANEFTLYALWEPVSHTHNYESFTTPPTCTTQGYTTHTCSRCGDCYVDTCVNALGHTGGTATCCKKAVCTRCGKEYGEFDPTNHAGGTEVKNAKAATEEAAGYTGDTYCKGCGKKLSTGKSIAAKVVTYKITYKLDGGKDPKNPTTYTYATSTIKLKNPTKKGYDFKGWYNGTKKVTEIKKGSKGNVTLTAKWSKITYKITYKLAGGKNAKNPTSYTVTTSTVKLQNPTRKGYTFKGWYNGSKKVTEIKKGSTGDVTLTAKWETITYKITYKLAGGKAVKNPTSYKVTTSTVTLKNPTKKGYTFKGWYNGKKKVTTIKKGSTGNITLTAKWAKKK